MNLLSSTLILLITFLSASRFIRAEDDDYNTLIDIDQPEIITFLDDYMFDPETADYCYYINQVLICFNMRELGFTRMLEKKNVQYIRILRLKGGELAIDSDFLNKFYENIQEVYLQDTRVLNLRLHDFKNVNRIVYENCGIDNLNYKMIPFTDLLQTVEIRYNRIQHISDVTFRESTRIIKLDLSHNDLRGIDRNAFKMLNELIELKLNHNFLKVLDVDLLENCTKLEHLNLAHNMIFHFEFYFFDATHNLRSLDISYNPIFNLDYGVFFGTRMQHLTSFKIDGLPCSTLITKIFEKLKRHYYLVISEKIAHIIQHRDPALCQQGSTACLFQGDLETDIREHLWWENRENNILCVDYFGQKWYKALRPLAQPNITELAEDLLRYTNYLAEREVYAVEMLSLKEFLTNFVKDVTNVHKTLGDVTFYDVYEVDRCYQN